VPLQVSNHRLQRERKLLMVSDSIVSNRQKSQGTGIARNRNRKEQESQGTGRTLGIADTPISLVSALPDRPTQNHRPRTTDPEPPNAGIEPFQIRSLQTSFGFDNLFGSLSFNTFPVTPLPCFSSDSSAFATKVIRRTLPAADRTESARSPAGPSPEPASNRSGPTGTRCSTATLAP
jgi:hypothetical protein